MNRSGVLAFILTVLALMGIAWAVFPASGVRAVGRTWRFLSREGDLEKLGEEGPDVEAALKRISGADSASLSSCRDFIRNNPARIYFPGDDYTWLDSVFASFETEARDSTTFRISYYGDSQIEMDRMSMNLRTALQERFGGSGTGIFPAMSNVPSASVFHNAEGNIVHYTMYGDSTTRRAPHRRYGLMAQLCEVSGPASVTFRAPMQRTTPENVRQFSKVSVLLAPKAGYGIRARLQVDTFKLTPQIIPAGEKGVQMISWDLPLPARRGTLRFDGKAEIYGIMLDDAAGGVAVDNMPLRGSSGTEFTAIDKSSIGDALQIGGTKLLILQFGGNSMPYLRNEKKITDYVDQLRRQLDYFHAVAPKVKILFIGPSDMCRDVNGRILSYPRLPAVVDSLRTLALNHGDAYWDIFSIMGGSGSMKQWVAHKPPLAGADYIHFTPAGADIMGRKLADAIMLYYDLYRLRRELGEQAAYEFLSSE